MRIGRWCALDSAHAYSWACYATRVAIGRYPWGSIGRMGQTLPIAAR
jgi:hypothetical protein